MAKRCLITGISGQLGEYLARELNNRGYEVYGMIRGQDNPKIPTLKEKLPFVNLVPGDLLDYKSILEAIKSSNPDHIYNLGAISFVPLSWQQPELVFQTNAMGPLKLLEAIKSLGRDIKYFQASTSEMFGSVPAPQNEDSQMLPRSPYGAAKLAAHRMCRVYRESYGMQIYCGIVFNSESVSRPEIFATRKITKAAARIKKGLQDSLTLGNLDAQRDWQAAEDAMRGVAMMVERAKPDDYCVASEESHTVKEFAEVAFRHVGLDYSKYTRVGSDFIRPADVNELRGNSSKLRRATGWTPLISFEELVYQMVDNDLNQAE